jgi:septal ring factor EnvC (AmiA/AmiB activator)
MTGGRRDLIQRLARETCWTQADVKRALDEGGNPSTEPAIYKALVHYAGQELAHRKRQIAAQKRVNKKQEQKINEMQSRIDNLEHQINNLEHQLEQLTASIQTLNNSILAANLKQQSQVTLQQVPVILSESE